MTAYLSGLMLGFALIVPIGPQNIVVLNQGLTVRFPKSCSRQPSPGSATPC